MTPRQERFVVEYLKDLNASAAAVRAGYSSKHAHRHGSRTLQLPAVRAAVQQAMDARAKRVQVKADDVLRELARVAFSDIADLFDHAGRLKPLDQIPEDARRAIVSVESDEIFEGMEPQAHGGSLRRGGADQRKVGVTRKIKLADKLRALDLLGKHLKLFTEVHEHHGLDGLAERIREAQKRAGIR